MENTKIKGWSYYEIGWLLAFSIIGLIISIMQKSDMLGLFVFMSGIFSFENVYPKMKRKRRATGPPSLYICDLLI